jgi:hypothetical protein
MRVHGARRDAPANSNVLQEIQRFYVVDDADQPYLATAASLRVVSLKTSARMIVRRHADQLFALSYLENPAATALAEPCMKAKLCAVATASATCLALGATSIMT